MRIRPAAKLRSRPATEPPKPNTTASWIRTTIISTLISTVVASSVNTSVSLYNSCRDDLQKDRQAFFRVSTELFRRSDIVALELSGQSIPKKVQFSEADVDRYAAYFTQDSPYLLKEFQGRSFNDLEFDVHDIVQRWYTPYFFDAHSNFAIHPAIDKLQHARLMFASLTTYRQNKEPMALAGAIDSAKKYMGSPGSWPFAPGEALGVQELGGACPKWRGPDTLRIWADRQRGSH